MERLGGERWDRRAGRAGVGPRWGRGRGTLRLHPRGCAPGPGGGPPSGPARSPAPRPRGRPRAAGRCGRTDHHPSPAHGRRRLHRRACRADHRVSRLPRDGAAAQRPSGRRPLGADLRRRLPARARLRGRPGRRAGPAAQVLPRARPAAEDQRAVLVETLRQWLLQWGNRPGIAQALTVHPQTMSGRLHRLRDLLADDLEDAVVRAELLVLLTAEGPPDRRPLLCSPCQESDNRGGLPGPGCEPVSSRKSWACG
ncbi:helix-turn-helix domain-containing protein [Micrococcus luteus]|uniref:helix-turn-helix domain-containing protein n=1 Tax=Micrococcus luteus TaxID=1270 RepID=UPI00398FFBD7